MGRNPRFWRVLLRSFGVIAILSVLAAAARADDADRATLKAQEDKLFQQMLANPANLDVAFAYADVAAKLGDNEAAISALERMLLFNPNLPRVDLELGALYFRLGSFDVAKTYFQKAAAANPPPPEEVQSRINEYLALIDKQLAPSRLTGSVFFGAQYQTDANIAPGGGTIGSPIGPILLNNQFVKQPDWDIFAAGSVLYSYDLGNQDHDTIEATGNSLVNHYMKFGRLDLDFLEVTAGPRFRFPDFPDTIAQAATFKPYLIGNEVGLGEHQYFYTGGFGLEETGVVLGDLSLRNVFEFRQKTFTNAADRPLSNGLSGSDKVISLSALKPITSNSALSFEFDYLDQETRFIYYSNQSYAAAISYHISYDELNEFFQLPFHFPMETTIYGSRLWSIYDGPDPCCNTSGTATFSPSSRDDRRWRFGLTQGIRVTDNIELVAQFERDVISSNLSLYGYTSNSVTFGPQIRF